ncbi:hypothetical protein BDL97_01G137600 [Sphagnum fallax]|nr:hypothetical protein BDL97_01G137600 [Sphagnum fallax]
MAVQLSEKTVVVKGHDECFIRAKELIEKFNLPGGLLPMEYIEEVTYDEETGYFRVKQRSKSSHKFALADKLVSYADEVKGYLQPNRIKNLSGVHAKEFFFWVPIGDISVDEPPTGKIHFKSYAGLGDSFSVEAFAPGQ